jgi:hypothetical protein
MAQTAGLASPPQFRHLGSGSSASMVAGSTWISMPGDAPTRIQALQTIDAAMALAQGTQRETGTQKQAIDVAGQQKTAP